VRENGVRFVALGPARAERGAALFFSERKRTVRALQERERFESLTCQLDRVGKET